MQSVEIRVRAEVAAAVRSLAEDADTLRAWLLRSWLEDMAADHDDLPGKPTVIHYRSFAAAIPATTAAALRQLANTSGMTHFEFTSQAVQAVLAAGDLAVLPEDDAVPTEEHTLVTFGLRPGQREALQTRLGHERRGIATLIRAIARIYVGSHPMKEHERVSTHISQAVLRTSVSDELAHNLAAHYGVTSLSDLLHHVVEQRTTDLQRELAVPFTDQSFQMDLGGNHEVIEALRALSEREQMSMSSLAREAIRSISPSTNLDGLRSQFAVGGQRAHTTIRLSSTEVRLVHRMREQSGNAALRHAVLEALGLYLVQAGVLAWDGKQWRAVATTNGSSRRHTVRTLAMTGDPDLLDDVRSLAEDLDRSIASLVEDGLGLLVADAGRGPVRRIRPLAIRIAKGNPNTSIGMTEKGMALLQQVQTMYGGPQNGALLAASSRVVTQYLERSNDLDGSGTSSPAHQRERELG